MNFDVRAELANPGSAQQAITRALSLRAKVLMEDAGRRMARRATEMMGQDWDLNRPYNRRRWPGSRRAATALDYQIDGSDFPTVRYRVLGGDEVFGRIVILNFGAKGHSISPSGNWPLTGVRNIPGSQFPHQRSGGGVPLVLSWPDMTSGRGVKYVSNHPGSPGSHFLERARDEIASEIAAENR